MNIHYTDEKLKLLSIDELVKMGVINKAVGSVMKKTSFTESPFEYAKLNGYISHIPIDLDKVMQVASKNGGSHTMIMGRAMSLGRGYLDPNQVREWIKKNEIPDKHH